MTPELLLLATAVALGAVHTAVGVDHTLPFVVLGKARGWSLKKTLLITGACALGHVLSSVLVGSLGVLLGITTQRLEAFEALRGNWAATLLIAFGGMYAAISLWRLFRGTAHAHLHVHADGTVHAHSHDHSRVEGRVMHTHPHRFTLSATRRAGRSLPLSGKRLVPALFVIFLLGPCEALIPLMFAPAASGHSLMPWLIALSFSLSTLATMLLLVGLGASMTHSALIDRLLARLEPHLNWAAGVTIALSGIAISALGI